MFKNFWFLFFCSFLAEMGCVSQIIPFQKHPTQPSSTPLLKNVTPSVTKDGLSVLESSVCQSIEEKTPMGIGTLFPRNVGKLFVFSKIALEASSKTFIRHNWYFSEKKIASVTLPIQGPQWRTYSSKQISPDCVGKWRVDLVTEKDEILQSLPFEIQ